MKRICPEGTMPFVYCGFGSPAPAEGDVVMGYKVRYGADDYIKKKVGSLPNVRLIIVPWVGNQSIATIHFLHWVEENEPLDLDEKVWSDQCTEDDFAASIRTEYSVTHCFTCNRNWHTLIVDPGDSYLGAPGLFEKKLAAREILRCPGCGSSLRQLVVMIIEEAVENTGTTGKGV